MPRHRTEAEKPSHVVIGEAPAAAEPVSIPSEEPTHKRKTSAGPSGGGKKPKAAAGGATPWSKRKGLQNIQWKTIPRPPWSMRSDNERDDWPTKNPDGTDHLYYVSKLGMEHYAHMMEQAANCDTEMQGVYLSNDFTGYGQIEVLENAIRLWQQEFQKKNPRAEELWYRMEPIAMWMNSDEFEWHMVDDGDRVVALCKLVAALFLETFRALHKEKLIHPDGPLKNIGMMAGLTALGRDPNAMHDYEMGWFDRIVGMCRHGGVDVELTPPEVGEQKRIEKYLNRDPAVYAVEDEMEWSDSDDEDDDILRGYNRSIDEYLDATITGTLGGTKFDITKMPKSQMKGILDLMEDELDFD